jgi:signal transduction histidine kinase
VATPSLAGLGFAQAPPRAVAAVPMCVGDELVGVVLVGSLHDLDRDAVAFLEHAAGQLGVALLNARAHARIRDLVAALQSRSEELQAHTEELQAQSEELHAQNEELLAQGAQLQEATHALGESNRRKSEFLAVLAHEIRNPLAPICNGIELLERAPPGGEIARRARETVARQARQLSRLVDALLDLTRVSRGQIALARSRLDLVPLVSDVVEDHRPLFAERGLHFEATLPSAPVLVCGDATRLTQIIGNLLHNAAKFTEAGGHVALTLGVDGDRGMLSVDDSGVGIDPEMLPDIFEPFTQADSSLDRSGVGLGLGLALVKGLVELHGGEIAVHSEGRGRGSRFVVSLPLDVPGGSQEEEAPGEG